MSKSHLSGVENCGLHKRTPYGITDVSMTQFSVARFSGACKFNGEFYTYFPDTDELIRDDVLRFLSKNKPTPSKRGWTKDLLGKP